MFSGESTARRPSLGSHNEEDFWDQVVEGALAAEVLVTMNHCVNRLTGLVI